MKRGRELPPASGSGSNEGRVIMLKYRGNDICEVRCDVADIEIPSVLNIVLSKDANRSALVETPHPFFRIRPETTQLPAAWLQLMTRLHGNSQVGIVGGSAAHAFHIVPLEEHSFESAAVYYKSTMVPVSGSAKEGKVIMLHTLGNKICPIRCLVDIEMPSLWNIHMSMPVVRLKKNEDDPHRLFFIHPEPNQTNEWRNLMSNIPHDQVAIARSDQYVFHIYPLQDEKFARAKVIYKEVETLHEQGGKPKTAKTESLVINMLPSFLQTIGHHHDWIFGAIAELLDNASDARASRFDISLGDRYYKKVKADIRVLSIVDDGHGMTHDDILDLMSLGHERVRVPDQIRRMGRSGIGFKMGAMRLGKDVLVITQTLNSRSVAFLSQTLNENKTVIKLPVVTYVRREHEVTIDTCVQSEELAKRHWKAIESASPFDQKVIGEEFVEFKNGTGTKIFIWNLDKWNGSRDYTLVLDNEEKYIVTCHRKIRTRLGQIGQQVPLDNSLREYLKYFFFSPRINISIQSSKVEAHALVSMLDITFTKDGVVMGKNVSLTLGVSWVEWERSNCGIFLYWHGRLIEAYKRVGCMVDSADDGRSVMGAIDVTNLMDDELAQVVLHNNKQRFLDSDRYIALVDWMAATVNAYWQAQRETITKHNMDM